MLLLLAGSAEARTHKGSGPTTIAVGYGAAWVGFGDGTVMRVDARTLEPLRRRIASRTGGYVMSIATGLDSVWVAAGGTPVKRLDPRTGSVRAMVRNQPGRWSGAGAQVATGAGFVWIADHERNAILRVSARTNRVSRRRALPHRLRSIAAGRTEVWVQTVSRHGRGIVSRLAPRTLRLRPVLSLECPTATLATAGRVLWVLDNCSGGLRGLGGTASEPIKTVRDAWSLAAGLGSVWVSDGASVHRIVGDRVVSRIPARGHVLAAGAERVWVLDLGDGGRAGWLRRIDPKRNRLVGRPIRLAAK
jgi:hypothetical protein